MTTRAGMHGHPPIVTVTRNNPERPKYERMWEISKYREFSPGEDFVPVFISRSTPKWGSHVIDFGCGSGKAARKLMQAGMRVTMLDFAKNCLDDDIRESLSDDLKFVRHDLMMPVPAIAEYGFCSDVMEHIPTASVDNVLSNILIAAKQVFFAIHTGDDVMGRKIADILHVTQKPGAWWKERLDALGFKVEWELSSEKEGGKYIFFYGSAWQDVADIAKEGTLNTEPEKVAENIAFNAGGDWLPVIPHDEQETEVMILGGGPTLAEHEDEIRRLRDSGVKLVTLNGTYNWCLERGIVPSATVLVDARPFNKRFVTPVVDGVKYLVSAQCDPSVFEGLPPDRTHIWYDGSDRTKEILGNMGKPGYFPVAGGSTVLTRAIPLLRMLGFHKFHLFGCDSCLMAPAGNGKSTFHHHAFPQPENDNQIVVPVILTGGTVFYCNPWMALQAREFIELVKMIGEDIDMIVYGNGLLSTIIKTGAELLPNEEA